MGDSVSHSGQFAKGEGGRPKGAVGKITREFKSLMDSILFDDIETTRTRLLEMRDSEDATDRKTFWGIATKLLPQKVEATVDGGLPLLVLEQDYVKGQTQEIEEDSGEGDERP